MLRRQKSEVGSRTSESLAPPRLTLVRPDAASQREAGGFRFPEQVVPIIRRIAVAQPSVEDHVGVCPRAGFAEGCFVVHPGVDDRLVDGTEAIEQPKAPQELCPAPMSMSWPRCVPELILDGVRIAGDLVQNQLGYWRGAAKANCP